MIRFLIIGDLHGVKPKIHTKNFDAIIAPGDICGEDLRHYMKLWIKKRTDENKRNIEFDQVCPPKKREELEKKSLDKGRKILEFLNSFNKPVFIVPGNWDQTSYIDGIPRDENNWEIIKEGLNNIKDIEFKKTIFEGITLIGHGSTSAPEVLNKDVPLEIFEDEAEYDEYLHRVKHFEKVHKKLHKHFKNSENPIILLTHNVPYGTKLDLVNKPGTYAHNQHYGSKIAREMIDTYQPLLCIGGHIHERHGKTRLKKTLCINAGFGGDVNTIVEVDIKKAKIINVEFLGNNKENE